MKTEYTTGWIEYLVGLTVCYDYNKFDPNLE